VLLLKTALCLPLLAAIAADPAMAQDAIPEKLDGYGGIVTQCVVHTRKAFAGIMCDGLVKAVADEAGKAGMDHAHLGSADWTKGDADYLGPDAGTAIVNPLYLTFYLRGTDGNPAGAHAWASLYAPVDAPLSGRLVIWEGATLGSGPPEPVAAAVADSVAGKMRPVIAALGKSMAN
jgi:hypothetical protein